MMTIGALHSADDNKHLQVPSFMSVTEEN